MIIFVHTSILLSKNFHFLILQYIFKSICCLRLVLNLERCHCTLWLFKKPESEWSPSTNSILKCCWIFFLLNGRYWSCQSQSSSSQGRSWKFKIKSPSVKDLFHGYRLFITHDDVIVEVSLWFPNKNIAYRYYLHSTDVIYSQTDSLRIWSKPGRTKISTQHLPTKNSSLEWKKKVELSCSETGTSP